MKKFRELSEELTPSSKPEPGREAVGGRFQSSAPKRPTKPAPIVTSEEIVSEIVMPQVKSDLGALDKTSFVKKHGVTKSVAKQRVAEAKDEEEYGYEGDMAMNQLKTIIRHSEYLMDMMKPDTDLPEWVQSKITLAADYIQTSCDYMTSEMNEAKEMGDDPTGDVPPRNLTVKKGKTVAAGPVTEATSAAVRMQRALDRIKQSREASEKRAQELLKPKQPTQPVQKEEVDESYDGPRGDKLMARSHAAYKAGDKETSTRAHQLAKKAGEKYRSNPENREKAIRHIMSGAKADYNKPGRNWTGDSVEYPEDTNVMSEGRPSQRHPLEGHEYHKKSDEALIHIAKDAHAAAEAMKGHNTTAENKYRDQANDSATVRHYRKTHGMQDWYKKKYGHVNESFRPMDEPNMNLSIQARQKKADDNKPPFDGPYKKTTGVVTDKSGAKHGPMSVARNLARQALKKQASKMSVKESLEESRKAEIVKEIMKKGKKSEENKFQAEPELGTTVVKADN